MKRMLVGILVGCVHGTGLAAQVLEPCDPSGPLAGLRCGTIEVPEDHGDPESRRIALNVVVAPGEGPTPDPDPLFILSGGPGQGAAAIAPFLLQGRTPEFASRDVVLIDQRGTGSSNPFDCPVAEVPTDHFGRILGSDESLSVCLRDVESRARPALYTTTQTAHDHDVVRQVLGYDQINLSGASYGTRLALEYTRRYPDRVRTVSLAGVAPVDFRVPLEYARLSQQALDRLFADCRADNACNRAFPELERVWDEVRERLADDGPARVSITVRDEAFEGSYSALDFAYTIRTMLYGPQALEIPALLYDTWRTGDYSPFAERHARRAEILWPQVALGLHLSVFCSEDVPFIADREIEAATKGTYLGTWVIDEYRRACAAWLRGEIPADFHEPVRSDVPVLVISGRRDPSTPPATGERARLHLPNSVHLVHRWGGHGFPGTPDQSCETEALETLLRTARVDSLDVSCADVEEAIPFEIPDAPLSAESARFETPTLTDIDIDASGQQLAYARVDLTGESPGSRIFLTGMGEWPGQAVGRGRMPRFRPGGGLSWLERGSAGEEIALVGLDGGRTARFGSGDAVLDYAWSPDGSLLAYARVSADGTVQLFVHDIDSGRGVQATRVYGNVHTDAFGARRKLRLGSGRRPHRLLDPGRRYVRERLPDGHLHPARGIRPDPSGDRTAGLGHLSPMVAGRHTHRLCHLFRGLEPVRSPRPGHRGHRERAPDRRGGRGRDVSRGPQRSRMVSRREGPSGSGGGRGVDPAAPHCTRRSHRAVVRRRARDRRISPHSPGCGPDRLPRVGSGAPVERVARGSGDR